MKRLSSSIYALAAVVSMIVILFQVAPPAQAATIFSDDFESGTSQWTVRSGTWSVTTDGSNVYSQTNTGVTARSTAGSSAWTDYTIQARVKLVSGSYAMLMARYQDSENYYFMTLRSTGTVEIKRMLDGASGNALQTHSGVLSPATGTWYTVTFKVEGNSLQGYIGENLVLDVTDSTFTTGLIGLGTASGAAEFDDVVVSDGAPTSYELAVTKTGTGSGSVASTPSGIDCGATCATSFGASTVVTLTAAADSGSTFAGWSGDCTGTGDCVITMNAAKSVVATFSSDSEPMLFITKAGNGDGLITSNPPAIDCGITCTAGFAASTVVTLTAAPDALSTSAGWSGEGCSGSDTCSVMMDAIRSVTATFQLSVVNVSKTGTGSGTVTSDPPGIDCGITCTAKFDYGTAVTLTATPAVDSVFASWSGARCGGSGDCVVTVDDYHTVTATFNLKTYALTVNKAGNGTGSVTSTPPGIDCGDACTNSFAIGAVVTLTATPGAASVFTDWSGDCTGTEECAVTMSAARNVTATFSTHLVYLPLVIRQGGTPPPVDDTIYVAPDGSESAPGTITQPTTLPSAITRVEPGGIIAMRGGIYTYTTPVIIAWGNNGTVGAPKQLFAHKDETPILNFAAMAEDSANRGLTINGSYWHIKGLIVEWAGDNGIFVGGSYNTIERCITRYNRDTGLQLSRYSSSALQSEWPAYNLILSCESHDNMDSDGEDADGFAAKLTSGEGNVFRHCVSHNNIDDGWDMYTKSETGPIGAVTIEHCISYENGTLSNGTTHGSGDRNGYKLGGEDIPVDHVFRYNLSYNNGKHGITWNRNPGNMEVTGNVSIDSTERNFNFDGSSSTFSNNVSCRGSSGTNDRIIGTDLGTNCWWTDGSNTCGVSACDPYSGELSWWFNPNGSLEYEFQ